MGSLGRYGMWRNGLPTAPFVPAAPLIAPLSPTTQHKGLGPCAPAAVHVKRHRQKRCHAEGRVKKELSFLTWNFWLQNRYACFGALVIGPRERDQTG